MSPTGVGLRHIEGASQRVQEDTMRFSTTVETLGVSLIQAVMNLIAFLPLLAQLSRHITKLPIIGQIPYSLVVLCDCLVTVWALSFLLLSE